jgi:hypothetical protein
MDLVQIARVLAFFGFSLCIAAGLLYLLSRLNLPSGLLPGDLVISRGNFSCVFPLVSSLLISIILTVLLNLLTRWLGK